MPFVLRPLDRILSSRGNVRLLRALHSIGAASGRRAATAAGLPAKTAWRALQSLVETQVVHREELSGQHLFRVNRDHHLWPSIEKLFADEDGMVEALFAHLRELLTGEKGGAPEVASVVTYGSSTRRGWSASSEMEILVLAQTDAATDPIRQAIAAAAPMIRKRFGVRLSTVVLTATRFEERRRGGDPYAIEVLSDAILIAGRDPREFAA